jgi:hypothetical protein
MLMDFDRDGEERMMNRIVSAPIGIDSTAWSQRESSSPKVGELWLLAWNGEPLGLAIVSGVTPTFVLVWPATWPGESVFAPAISIDTSIGGLFAWPTRETGVGKHLLHSRLDKPVSERTMALVLESLDNDSESPLSYAPAGPDNQARLTQEDEMLDRWEQICLNVWPKPALGAEPLNPDALRAVSLRVSDVSRVLNIDSAESVALFRGESFPTAEQVSAISVATGLEPGELLSSPFSEDVLFLLSPELKGSIEKIGEARDLDEDGARALIRSEYALAARSDGDPRARLFDTVQRLASGLDG